MAYHEIGNGHHGEASYSPRPICLQARSEKLLHQMGRSRGIPLGPRSGSKELHLEECDISLRSAQRDCDQQWVSIHLIRIPRLLQGMGNQTLLLHSPLSTGQWVSGVDKQDSHQHHQETARESQGSLGKRATKCALGL